MVMPPIDYLEDCFRNSGCVATNGGEDEYNWEALYSFVCSWFRPPVPSR